MITITRVKQAAKAFIKVLRYGKNDVQTALPAMPWGIDSKPVKNELAIYAKTGNNAEPVIIGYIKNFEGAEGETRIYATDTDGNDVFDIKLKGDGTCEIGGDSDNMVRYSDLNNELQSFVSNLNTQLSSALSGIPYTWLDVTLDISDSKIDEIKTF